MKKNIIIRIIIIITLILVYLFVSRYFAIKTEESAQEVTFVCEETSINAMFENEDIEDSVEVYKIIIAGEFSDWSYNNENFEMTKTDDNRWEISLYLNPGANPYKYVVYLNNRYIFWVEDYLAEKYTYNSYGTRNSVYFIPDYMTYQTIFRFIVVWSIISLVLITVLELLLRIFMKAKLSLKYKIAFVFIIFLIGSNVYFIFMTRNQRIEEIKQGHVELINSVHLALSVYGVDFTKLDEDINRELSQSYLTNYLNGALIGIEDQYFSNRKIQFSSIYLHDSEGDIIAYANSPAIMMDEIRYSGSYENLIDELNIRSMELYEQAYIHFPKNGITYYENFDYSSELRQYDMPKKSIRHMKNSKRPFKYSSFYYPIIEDNQYRGFYIVDFNVYNINDEINKKLYLNLILIAIFGIIFFILINQIGKIILEPLYRLIDGMKKLKNKNWDFRIQNDSNDEIERLGEAYNFMAEELKASEDRIREYANNLENKVHERTYELREANKKLKEIDRVKSQFFANISHELRTPLTLIMAPLEAVLNGERGEISEDLKDYLKVMYNNSGRLLKLINNLLELSRADAGKTKTVFSKVNLTEMALFYISNLKSYADIKDISLKAADNRDEFVYLDTEKTDKIIMNLLSNALKFTGNGGTITVGVKGHNDFVELWVKDTGKGIPKEKLDVIFDRFMQIDYKKKQEQEGTGIGLYLVKQLIELQGGYIEVESEKGEGSTFRAFFKKGKPDENSGEVIVSQELISFDEDKLHFTYFDSVREPEVKKYEKLLTGNDKAYSILVVEDDEDLRKMVSDMLSADYQVFTAVNGEDGLNSAREMMPDLIISDVMMPIMSGYELSEAVGNDEKLRHIPVILLTAKTETEHKIKGLKHGAIDYIYKPFKKSELLSKIENIFRIQKYKKLIIDKEKLITLGTLTGGLMHEIKNPITYISGNLPPLINMTEKMEKVLISAGADKQDYKTIIKNMKDTVRMIETGSNKIVQLVESFKIFLYKGQSLSEKVAVRKSVESVINILSSKIDENIKITINIDNEHYLMANHGHFTQAIMNLIDNAVQAMPAGGHLELRSYTEENKMIIEVADTGNGIDERLREQIFEPFFTTRDVGDGMGLGLYLTRSLIESMGGDISFRSKSGEGTVFYVRLPSA